MIFFFDLPTPATQAGQQLQWLTFGVQNCPAGQSDGTKLDEHWNVPSHGGQISCELISTIVSKITVKIK